MLDIQLADYRNGWEMDADGNYHKRVPRNEDEETGSQQRLIEIAHGDYAVGRESWVAAQHDRDPAGQQSADRFKRPPTHHDVVPHRETLESLQIRRQMPRQLTVTSDDVVLRSGDDQR